MVCSPFQGTCVHPVLLAGFVLIYIYDLCCRVILRFAYPKKSYFSRKPREIWLLRVNKASYFPTTRAIIVYYTEITHTTTKHFLTIETRRVIALCVLPVGVASGIHEVLCSWYVTFFNYSQTLLHLWGIIIFAQSLFFCVVIY